MFQPFHVAVVLFSGVISRFLPPSLHYFPYLCSDGIGFGNIYYQASFELSQSASISANPSAGFICGLRSKMPAQS